jgi:multiple sugar transport system substrate-binding protein
VLEGYNLAISTGAPLEQQELARQFILWFLKPETQERWLQLGGLPILQSQWQHPAFTNRPYAGVYTSSVVNVAGFWNVPVYVGLMRHMQKAVGDSLDGYIDPATALGQMMDGCGDLLRERAILREY